MIRRAYPADPVTDDHRNVGMAVFTIPRGACGAGIESVPLGGKLVKFRLCFDEWPTIVSGPGKVSNTRVAVPTLTVLGALPPRACEPRSRVVDTPGEVAWTLKVSLPLPPRI